MNKYSVTLNEYAEEAFVPLMLAAKNKNSDLVIEPTSNPFAFEIQSEFDIDLLLDQSPEVKHYTTK